jgi:hypothetical protein
MPYIAIIKMLMPRAAGGLSAKIYGPETGWTAQKMRLDV